MALADAAKSGPEAVNAKLGPVLDACKACHDDYRVNKN